MKEFIDSYEKDLQNSTELVNEDLKKAKANFWRTSKGKADQLTETINNVCTKYNLVPLKIDGKLNPNIRGKREGDYNIRLYLSHDTEKKRQFFWINSVKRQLNLVVKDAETDEPIKGQPPTIGIKMKSSWTEEQLTDAINKGLANFGVKLTGSNGKIKEQQMVGGGITTKQLLKYFNASGFNRDEQIDILKRCLSAWDKLDETEVKEFKKLLEVN